MSDFRCNSYRLGRISTVAEARAQNAIVPRKKTQELREKILSRSGWAQLIRLGGLLTGLGAPVK
jgi:hypothetical protein